MAFKETKYINLKKGKQKVFKKSKIKKIKVKSKKRGKLNFSGKNAK
ncbi:hypothetical protein ACFFWB_26670 [Flavobacterium procerum]